MKNNILCLTNETCYVSWCNSTSCCIKYWNYSWKEVNPQIKMFKLTCRPDLLKTACSDFEQIMRVSVTSSLICLQSPSTQHAPNILFWQTIYLKQWWICFLQLTGVWFTETGIQPGRGLGFSSHCVLQFSKIFKPARTQTSLFAPFRHTSVSSFLRLLSSNNKD